MASHKQDAKQEEPPPNSEPVLAAISDLGRGFYRELLDRVDDGVYFVDRDRRLLPGQHPVPRRRTRPRPLQ